MVRIRLRRVGSRKNPVWRVVVADRRSPRDGRTIETIGHYNPQTDPSVIEIDEERARHWLDHGAQPTRTVATPAAHQGHRGRRAPSSPGRSRCATWSSSWSGRWSPTPTRFASRSSTRRRHRPRGPRRRRRPRPRDRPRGPGRQRDPHLAKAAATREDGRVMVEIVEEPSAAPLASAADGSCRDAH